MERLLLFSAALVFAMTGCMRDNSPFSPTGPGDMPGGQTISQLKDPALAWSADSFEATIGIENGFPTLTNTYKVSVSYESSQPEVATINENGVITLVSGGSTMIKASSAANETYSASSDSYLLTVLDPGSEDEDGELSFASTGDPTSDDDISTSSFKGRITVTYSETGNATVEGDSYGYVTVDGNKVTVNNTGGEVLIYELRGTTSNGFFKVYGIKKQATLTVSVSPTPTAQR